MYRRRALGIQLTALTLVLIGVYLIPSIFVMIPAGHGGVLYRRFGYFGLVQAGTDTSRYYPEGIRMKFPWDEMILYNIRLQDTTHDFDVIVRNGLEIKVEISLRFRPLDTELGNLHKFAGPDFVNLLVVPELGAHARKQMALVDAAELYTSRRAEVEQAIQRNLVEEFEVRFDPVDALNSSASHLRRQIIRLLATSLTPLDAPTIARQLGIEPVDFLTEDVAALVRDNIVHQLVVDGTTVYRLNTEVVADRQHAEDIIGQGRPLIYVEDVLIRKVDLPEQIERAIQNKLVIEQQTLEYDFRLIREQKERDRKRIEAEGIRQFQDIVNEGISDRYLKWKGIDATLELAKSHNTKVVVIGSAGDGLPIILGPLESTAAPETTTPRPPGTPTPPASPLQEPLPPLSDNTPVGRRGTTAGATATPLGVPPMPPTVPFLQVPPSTGPSAGGASPAPAAKPPAPKPPGS
jgi:regulator of protease activity HflC (stomatin/prohibitin superfamily)